MFPILNTFILQLSYLSPLPHFPRSVSLISLTFVSLLPSPPISHHHLLHFRIFPHYSHFCICLISLAFTSLPPPLFASPLRLPHFPRIRISLAYATLLISCFPRYLLCACHPLIICPVPVILSLSLVFIPVFVLHYFSPSSFYYYFYFFSFFFFLLPFFFINLLLLFFLSRLLLFFLSLSSSSSSSSPFFFLVFFWRGFILRHRGFHLCCCVVYLFVYVFTLLILDDVRKCIHKCVGTVVNEASKPSSEAR